MRIKTTLCVVAMTCVSAVHAQTYYPPEKIHCNIAAGVLRCDGFNHQYLQEDKTTATTMESNAEFSFHIGEASYSMRHDMCMLTYTYINKRSETVRLRMVMPTIRPDFEKGHWSMVDNWYFTCTGGSQHCPMIFWSE